MLFWVVGIYCHSVSVRILQDDVEEPNFFQTSCFLQFINTAIVLGKKFRCLFPGLVHYIVLTVLCQEKEYHRYAS